MLSDLHEDSSVMHVSTSSKESVVSGAYAEGRQKDDRVYCKRKRPNAKEVRVKIESDDNNYEDSNQIELRNVKEYNETIDLPTDNTDSQQIEDLPTILNGIHTHNCSKSAKTFCKRKLLRNVKEYNETIDLPTDNTDSHQIEDLPTILNGIHTRNRLKSANTYCKRKLSRNVKEYNKTIDLPTDKDSHQIEDLPTILNGIHTRNRLKSVNAYCKRKLSESKEVIVKREADDDDDNEDSKQITSPPDDSESHQIELRTNIDSGKGIDLHNVADVTTPSEKQQENVTSKELQNDTIVELKVGEKVLRINTNISQWIEKHKNLFLIQKSVRRTTLPTVTIQMSKHTMTDFAITPACDTLPPEDRNLKAFFDSMLRATQRLPTFHQRRIKGDLVKALCNQGVDVYSCFVKLASNS